MNKSIILLLLFCTAFLSAQNFKNFPWHIVADDIDPNNYYGVTVADGVKQLPSKLPKAWKSLNLNGIGKDETTFTLNK